MTIEDGDVNIDSELSMMEDLLSKPGKEVDDLGGDVISTEPEPDEETQTRLDKKRERGRMLKAFEEEKAARAQADARLSALERQNAELRSQLERPAQRQPPANNPRAELDALYDAMEGLNGSYEALLARNGGKVDPDTEREFKSRWRRMEEQRNLIMIKATAQPTQAVPTSQELIQEQNRLRNMDVYDGGQVQQWANARYGLLAAELSDASGRLQVDPEQLHERVMADARQKFKLQRARARRDPTDAQLARHQGRSAGGRGGGGPKTVRMTSDRKAMADALYPEISDPTERYKKWAQTAGSQLTD